MLLSCKQDGPFVDFVCEFVSIDVRVFFFFKILMLGHVQASEERFSIEWQHVYKACSKCSKLVRQMLPPLKSK